MRNKLLILLMTLFLPLFTMGQWNTAGGLDANRINFGFQLGVNTNTLILDKEPGFQKESIHTAATLNNPAATYSGPLKTMKATFNTGFHLGLVANLNINDNLDLRFTPDVNFSDRVVNYTYDTTGAPKPYLQGVKKTIASTFIDLPLVLKFKSDRKGNIRSYIIGGFQYSHDIVPRTKTDDSNSLEVNKLLKIRRDMLSYKVGLGLDFYYEYFKMSPELSVTNGLVNGLATQNSSFSRPISRMFPTAIMLTLYFE